ncbi:tetraspanin-19-like [Amaranthus tricolor]|uniref:tetraspanin-19-like n=1 Tax=Amaranthus tricolor TaxID=29722 RepID=UPI00259125A2|nr:tetraspanin-19-like [Amaranthus tricolor]
MDRRASKGSCVAVTLKLTNSIMTITAIATFIYSAWIVAVSLRDNQTVTLSWFLWACIGTGGIFGFVAFIGNAGATTRLHCLLSSYIFFLFLLICLEGLLTADICLNKDWYKDFPPDPTGRFDAFVRFVDSKKENFRKLGYFIASSQVISFLLALVLRSSRPPKPRLDFEDEEVIITKLPLLNPENHYSGLPPYAVGQPYPHYYYAAASYARTLGYPDRDETNKGKNMAVTTKTMPRDY